MTETTPRLDLPLIAAGQAQKEIVHNEALAILEHLTLPVAETIGDAAPPADAAVGRSWIVGAAPIGAWTGQAGAIACRTAGGWRFVTPVSGMALWVEAEGCWARFDGYAWEIGIVAARSIQVAGQSVVRERQPGILAPAGGVMVDAEARASLTAILETLRNHGLIER
ncbi:DUF2793 domain-containing protein [Sphingomonas sp. 1P06PA]|uniref:DUF2793 domain-containing protein n=1 Tax=Sphingomonas sp. 1P06PA TaxID=554121 RepID=UPI0039A6FD08